MIEVGNTFRILLAALLPRAFVFVSTFEDTFYLESIFYSMSLSILNILCWSFLELLHSLLYVVWSLLRRSLRFCWRQSTFHFDVQHADLLRFADAPFETCFGLKAYGCHPWELIALATWLAVKPRSCKNALPPVNMWRCWERSRWFHRMRSRRHFHMSGLVAFFNLWFDWFKIEDSVLRSVTVEHAHKLDHNLKLSWNISK